MANSRSKYTKKQLENLSIEELKKLDNQLSVPSKPTRPRPLPTKPKPLPSQIGGDVVLTQEQQDCATDASLCSSYGLALQTLCVLSGATPPHGGSYQQQPSGGCIDGLISCATDMPDEGNFIGVSCIDGISIQQNQWTDGYGTQNEFLNQLSDVCNGYTGHTNNTGRCMTWNEAYATGLMYDDGTYTNISDFTENSEWCVNVQCDEDDEGICDCVDDYHVWCEFDGLVTGLTTENTFVGCDPVSGYVEENTFDDDYFTDFDGHQFHNFSQVGYEYGSPLPDNECTGAPASIPEGASCGNPPGIYCIQEMVTVYGGTLDGLPNIICLPEGAYEVNGNVVLESNTVLRGHPDGTYLWFSDGSGFTSVTAPTDAGVAEKNLIQPTPMGSNTLLLDNRDGLSVGDDIHIMLDKTMEFIDSYDMRGYWGGTEYEMANCDPTGAQGTGADGGCTPKGGDGVYRTMYSRKIIDTLYDQITIDVPVRMDIGTSNLPAVVKKVNYHFENIGIEDLFISNAYEDYDMAWGQEGTNAISWGGVKNSWIRNVHSFAPVEKFGGVDTSGDVNKVGSVLPTDYPTKGAWTNLFESLIGYMPDCEGILNSSCDSISMFEFALDFILVPELISNVPTEQRHLASSGIYISSWSKNVTVTNCSMKLPQNRGEAGRGYMFLTSNANEILFEDCEAYRGRHNFMTSNEATGVVFSKLYSSGGWGFSGDGIGGRDADYYSRYFNLEIIGLGNIGKSDTHGLLSHAVLFTDSDILDGLSLGNRQFLSGGAGHTSLDTVLWNIRGPGENGNPPHTGWETMAVPGMGLLASFSADNGYVVNTSDAYLNIFMDAYNPYEQGNWMMDQLEPLLASDFHMTTSKSGIFNMILNFNERILLQVMNDRYLTDPLIYAVQDKPCIDEMGWDNNNFPFPQGNQCFIVEAINTGCGGADYNGVIWDMYIAGVGSINLSYHSDDDTITVSMGNVHLNGWMEIDSLGFLCPHIHGPFDATFNLTVELNLTLQTISTPVLSNEYFYVDDKSGLGNWGVYDGVYDWLLSSLMTDEVFVAISAAFAQVLEEYQDDQLVGLWEMVDTVESYVATGTSDSILLLEEMITHPAIDVSQDTSPNDIRLEVDGVPNLYDLQRYRPPN